MVRYVTQPFIFLSVQHNSNAPSGAVHRGQEGNQIDGRIARASYGVTNYVTWDSAEHSPEEAHWNSLEENWIVSDRMSWFIKKVRDPLELPMIQPTYGNFALKLTC